VPAASFFEPNVTSAKMELIRPDPGDTIMATVTRKTAAAEADEYTLPPFLHRVCIRGYKSIAFCDVALRPLTILVGRNAAGKSNFLDALAFLRDTMDYGITEAVKRRGGWPSIVCRSARTSRIAFEIEAGFACGRPHRRLNGKGFSALAPAAGEAVGNLEGKQFVAKYSLELSADAHGIPVLAGEELVICDDTQAIAARYKIQGETLQENWSSPDCSKYPVRPFSEEVRAVYRPGQQLLRVLGSQPCIELADGLRHMGFYNFHPDEIRKLQKPNPGWLLDRDGHNLASVLAGLKENDSETFDRVRDYLRVVAQEIENFQVTPLGEYETVRFRLQKGSGEAPLEFDAAGMSDGTLRVLAALAAAFQVVLPRGLPSVVGIEEPENALHPAAMRALVDALDDATQRTQIILTSHSGDLLSGRDVNPGQVLVVRSRGGQTHLTPIDAASRKIIEKELYSLADLQRMDRLDIDEADLKRQVELSRNGGT
jgi:predicted ATPase